MVHWNREGHDDFVKTRQINNKFVGKTFLLKNYAVDTVNSNNSLASFIIKCNEGGESSFTLRF